ncbi:hypothetical protein [Pseudomonas sp. P9_31]|uniref:hypothetical protein n=1 Tax=Pseudomonas sp. P9_31 TaxID=3043448 RepID=UPI002A363368|nr:hypothetical protein [Pseudomonas sp. P9_31]WPN60490.1 hypothetical protein QMK51_13195 [Pseudomonas sp. P9_31]
MALSSQLSTGQVLLRLHWIAARLTTLPYAGWAEELPNLAAEYEPSIACSEPILKRFIAAEMTHTGFPFISSTSAVVDYGVSLTEWATTLAIRTLTLRYLLLAHCDAHAQQAPDPQKTVDLVYRFCRAANHNAVTASERTLRNAIGERGPAYLCALIAQMTNE